jgi:hypothetical protein
MAKKMRSYGAGNKCEPVVTSPTSANRKMNANVTVSTSPSPANKKMNADVKVNPSR